WHAGSDGDRVGLMTGEIGGGIQLDGMQVYDRAVKMMTDTLNRLHSEGPEPDVIVGHQANSRILQKISDQVDAGGAVFVDSVSRFGNTSAASIPLALGTCVAEQSIPATGRMTLVAYGAGEAWGGVSLDYDLADAMTRGPS
ncbi:MAG TPA: 3-oxoacyl-[acyl-carrier-protein] synthase III C-terminal domain-containing protein, partial [Mycobacterium sp.]|nr:3-oxoacyl-[acyl-carrier-protein] synthase III C-terminal domain-containing protein [Mycobacterium sp.]